MKKNAKKFSYAILMGVLILMQILITTTVNATENKKIESKGTADIILETNMQILKKDAELKVIIKNNLQDVDSLQIITGELKYDKSILEIVANDNEPELAKVEDKNDWSTIIGRENTSFISQSTSAKNGEMFVLTFKILDNKKDATIEINNLKITNANYEIKDLTSEQIIVKSKKNNTIFIVGIVVIIAIILIALLLKKNKK